MPTHKEIEEACVADYKKYEGVIVLATTVHGMFAHSVEEPTFDEPVRVRIDKGQNSKSFINWTTNEWCDPNWDVTLLEPHELLSNASSLWIDGISHSTDGKDDHGSWVVDEDQTVPAVSEAKPKNALNQNIEIDPPLGDRETMSTIQCPSCHAIIIQRLTPNQKHNAPR